MINNATVNYVLIPIVLAALLALWPAWLLLYRITFSSRRWWISGLRLIAVILFSAGLGALAFHIPFWLSSGKTVGLFETLIDLLLYGLFPLIAVGLVAYAMDHFSERPMMIVVAAATCISVAGLPVAYLFLGTSFHEMHNVKFEKQEPEVDNGLVVEPTVEGAVEDAESALDEPGANGVDGTNSTTAEAQGAANQSSTAADAAARQ